MEVINGTTMEHSFTQMIIDMAASLDEIIAGQFDFSEGMGAEEIYDEIAEGLPAVIDFLRQEYHQGHGIDPSIVMLRERLYNVSRIIKDYQVNHNLMNNVNNSNNFGRITTIFVENPNIWNGVRELCDEFVEWIEQYYPSITLEKDTNSDIKRKSTAAIRLSSQELQEVRRELVNAGLIVDDKWTGSPAEYGELVRHLKDDCGVENRGGYAWKDCRCFAGYEGSDKSAQNAITSNQGDIRSDAAQTIRDICLRCKGKLKNRDL